MDSITGNSIAISRTLNNHIGEEVSDNQIGAGLSEIEEKVIEILESFEYKKSSLISILLKIQEEYNYLPKEAITAVADKLGIHAIQVYSVATFYKVFSLTPRGKYIINVCLGTACHVRGGSRIVDEIRNKLNIDVGETTEDMQFSLETVRCLGACALGPVMEINGEYYGQLDAKKTNAALQKYKAEEMDS